MNDMTNDKYIILNEVIQWDRKSPFRIFIGFLLFLAILIFLFILTDRILRDSFLDFLIDSLTIVIFFAAIVSSALIVNFIVPRKKGNVVYLNSREIIVDNGFIKNKIENRNLTEKFLRGFSIRIKDLTGKSMIIPINVGFVNENTQNNLECFYTLRVNAGSVELVKTTMNISQEKSQTEVVELPK